MQGESLVLLLRVDTGTSDDEAIAALMIVMGSSDMVPILKALARIL